MKFDRDSVPATPAEAVQAVLDALELAEVETICAPDFEMADLHFTLGRYIRNLWSMWQTDMPLMRRYREMFRIGHPDDVSMMILSEAAARVRNEPFDSAAYVAACHAHWRAHGCDGMGQPLDPKGS